MNVTQLRQAARQIWDAALQRANPSTCVRDALSLKDGILSVGSRQYPLGGRLFVIGAGKASARMAQAVEEILDDEITGGLVVTKYGHSLPLHRIEIVEAGHPIPDAAGVSGVEQTRAMVSDLVSDDIVICLVSGGCSALWPAPTEGITLEQKQQVTSLLLRAGATI